MTKGLGIAQVAGLATEFTNYTDTSVGKVHGRIDSLQRTHDFNHQRVLEAITEKMNLVNREIEDLHRESMTAVNGTYVVAHLRVLKARIYNLGIAPFAKDWSPVK